jgi:very-short-patch-repair endonuclease
LFEDRNISKRGTPNSIMPIIFTHQTNHDKIRLSKEFRKNPTKAEKRLWNRLRAHRLDGLHFRRQVVLGPYIVDFICYTARLVIEADGDIHLNQKDMDLERDRFLESLGLRVIHISNEEILHDEENVVSSIRQACKKLSKSKEDIPDRLSFLYHEKKILI